AGDLRANDLRYLFVELRTLGGVALGPCLCDEIARDRLLPTPGGASLRPWREERREDVVRVRRDRGRLELERGGAGDPRPPRLDRAGPRRDAALRGGGGE